MNNTSDSANMTTRTKGDEMSKRKPRKPVHNSFVIGHSVWGPCVMHKQSGRFWYGIDHIRAIGTFFLKAADWLSEMKK